MALIIDIAIDDPRWPREDALRELSERTLDAAIRHLGPDMPEDCELSLLFTDDARIQELNAEWRGRDEPTNVLSFPAFPIEKGGPLPPLLGDIALARETVESEAQGESKPFDNHLTHLILHGFLHLLGYDHETDAEAGEMEEI